MLCSMFNDYILVLTLFLSLIKVTFLTLPSVKAVEPCFNVSLGNNFAMFSISFTENLLLKVDILYVEPMVFLYVFFIDEIL